MSLSLAGLQFLRPAWLLALLLLPLLAWAWRLRARRRSAWRDAVDPHLLPRLIASGGGGATARLAGASVLAGLALALVALAGPSWRGVEQPLRASGGALVIALDLSSSTLANDLQPTRLAQARARIGALLEAHAGEAALVAYAEDAFVVSPLTPDAHNVAVFLDALAPDLMPVDGQRPDRAIARACALLEQGGHARGDVLLLAAEANPAAVATAGLAAADGCRVSVLAMGTATGAGYRGRDGGIHRSALDTARLQALAAAGGGRFHAWDEAPAAVVEAFAGGEGGARATAHGGLVPEDGGYWLLPLAMLLLLAVFRRGGVLAVLALGLALPLLPLQPALAADAGEDATASPPAGSLWRRADQAAHQRSATAEAAYRAGDFEAAAAGFKRLPGADAAYNRGNALARAGRYEAAIAAYDQALREQPGMADAIANRAAVVAAMERERSGPGGDGRGDGDGGSGAEGRPDQGNDAGAQDPGSDGSDGEAPPPEPSGAGADDPSARQGDGGQDGAGAQQDTGPETGADSEAEARRRAAEQAQREAMERALEAAAQAGGEPGPQPVQGNAGDERDEANAAWLRRVPDDPGALLRARFRNEHLRRRAEER